MQEYSFVSIGMKRHREGLAPEKDYKEVIRNKAAGGWKFVQAIPFDAHLEPRLDLVFTRKAKK